jgi:aspartate aminotransferase
MIQLSERLLAMEESATIAMAKKSRELKSQGMDVISLSLGEPDFHTPDFIKAAAVEALEQNYTTYTPVPGYDDLREAIAHKFQRDNNLSYTKDQIVVSTGAKQSIANLVLSLINPDDEVIIPAPYWVSYLEIVKVAEGVPVVISAGIDKDFKITGADLEAAITPRTKLFMFSTPCNPTGSVYTKAELQDLARVLAKYPQVIAMSDEIYEHINFIGKHESLAQFPEIYNQVVTVNGVSKAWAMTGWRIGFVAGNALLVRAYGDVKDNSDSGQFLGIQKAGAAGLDEVSIPKAIAAKYSRRMDKLVGVLAKLGFQVRKPGAGFFLYMPAPKSATGPSGTVSFDSGEAFSQWMITEHLISTVPWDDCGSFVRFSVTFVSDKGEAGEAEVIAEVERRLSGWKFSF